MLGTDDDESDIRVLSTQGGAEVLLIDDDLVVKQGRRVRRSEETAMRLVKQYFPGFPSPELAFTRYSATRGRLFMDFVPGSQLNLIWDTLDDVTKERLCNKTWAVISQLRQIPKPAELSHLYQCAADGSPSDDVLIKDLQDPPTPLYDDDALRERICQRYYHFWGRKFTEELPHMLPRSDLSVFTHGDIAPHNILVDEFNDITGIIDWECAGWYPDYWEYANILKPRKETDWNNWMARTAPRQWDISGIVAARRVLF